MPGKLRWLTIATIIVTAAATLTTGGGFLLTIPLILGLIAEKWASRRGRWLVWVGATYLSVTVLQMEIVILPELLANPWGGLGPVLTPLWIASIALIIWCDVVLVIDGVKRRERTSPETGPPGAADWLVWISALLFSVYAFWGIPFLLRAYRHGFDRPDILLTDIEIVAIAILFDMMLVADALKMWRKPVQN
jgi:hypothetical protein